MIGVGETEEEVEKLIDDLDQAGCDLVTIGQYLPPSEKHAKLSHFVRPEEFEMYKKIAYSKGFLMVSSSPLTRSSYHASEDFVRLKKARELSLSLN